MDRLFVVVGFIGVLLGSLHSPTVAQGTSGLNHQVEVGTTTQVVLMERAPTAIGVGGNVSWWSGSGWGVRAEVRRDAGVNRDIQDAYLNAAQWGDHRRFNGTIAVLWEPMRGTVGSVEHSLRLHAGPTLQRQRGRPRDGSGTFRMIRCCCE
jgi:hypothetical protein